MVQQEKNDWKIKLWIFFWECGSVSVVFLSLISACQIYLELCICRMFEYDASPYWSKPSPLSFELSQCVCVVRNRFPGGTFPGTTCKQKSEKEHRFVTIQSDFGAFRPKYWWVQMWLNLLVTQDAIFPATLCPDAVSMVSEWLCDVHATTSSIPLTLSFASLQRKSKEKNEIKRKEAQTTKERKRFSDKSVNSFILSSRARKWIEMIGSKNVTIATKKKK